MSQVKVATERHLITGIGKIAVSKDCNNAFKAAQDFAHVYTGTAPYFFDCCPDMELLEDGRYLVSFTVKDKITRLPYSGTDFATRYEALAAEYAN